MKLRHALRGTAVGLLLAVCLTTPTLALTGVVDVGGSTLRVRKTASTGSAVLDQLPSGKQVEVVDTATNGWYGIQLGRRATSPQATSSCLRKPPLSSRQKSAR